MARWSRSRSSRPAGSRAEKSVSSGDRQAERDATFRTVLEEVLQSQEIATQLQHATLTDEELRSLAEGSKRSLEQAAAPSQRHSEELAEELRRVRRIRRRAAMRAGHEFLTHPYLHAAAATAGLLAVVVSFGPRVLSLGNGAGRSELLFLGGVALLVLAMGDCLAGYERSKAGRAVIPALRPLLVILTGLAAAAVGVAEANQLVQFDGAVWLAFWVLVAIDAAVAGLLLYRRLAAARRQRRLTSGETPTHPSENNEDWPPWNEAWAWDKGKP
jgi:hypothetical protein